MSDAKVTQKGIFSRPTKKAGNRKRLSALNLQQWAGRELNPRHTDFQSELAFCKYLSINGLCLSNKDL